MRYWVEVLVVCMRNGRIMNDADHTKELCVAHTTLTCFCPHTALLLEGPFVMQLVMTCGSLDEPDWRGWGWRWKGAGVSKIRKAEAMNQAGWGVSAGSRESTREAQSRPALGEVGTETPRRRWSPVWGPRKLSWGTVTKACAEGRRNVLPLLRGLRTGRWVWEGRGPYLPQQVGISGRWE